MSRLRPYISGWCSPGGNGHLRCLGAYGAPGPVSRCHCACHEHPAPPAVDGQLDLIESTP
jgi:hypothetical protein